MPPRRYQDTFFTEEQVKVLDMRAKGMNVDEIAKKLGISRTSVYSVLRSALTIVRKARNTLNLYAKLMKEISVNIPRNTNLNDVVNIVLKEADLHNVRLQLRSSEIVLFVIRNVPFECIDMNKLKLLCDISLTVSYDGLLKNVLVSE
ncbi:MAG: hypothetical protein B6U85_08070 [Desulfurococcales archaeon ex4484_42]|nr:MAG: hypothetical protein B6U85_08070 [Desulfurococcales archaeon ex4484_42]